MDAQPVQSPTNPPDGSQTHAVYTDSVELGERYGAGGRNASILFSISLFIVGVVGCVSEMEVVEYVNHAIAPDISVICGDTRNVLADDAICNRPTGHCENSPESGE